MSTARTSRRLTGLYPRTWRARYGDELAALIVESSGGGRIPWRTRIDVALAAGREHVRELRAGGASRPAGERVRAGALLVLWAWVLLACAGVAVEKLSEHWQGATSATGRSLPATAFECLLAAAAVGSALVVAGIAATAPSAIAYLRSGGFRSVRRSLARSAILTALTAVSGLGVLAWAHRLSTPERNGHDALYGLAVLALAVLAASSLASWAATAGAIARRLELSPATLRFEAGIAAAAALCMAAMTASTALWWRGLAHAAPWFLAGRPAGTPSSALPPELAVATAAMAIATALGAIGARRALRASALLARH
jgi:hypothetical protein